MGPIRPNDLAAENRKVLRFVSSIPATKTSKKRIAKASRAFKVNKRAIRKAPGDQAAKQYKKRYHHELSVLHGDKIPTCGESLDLLISLIPHLDDTAGYGNEELMAMAPFLVMLI